YLTSVLAFCPLLQVVSAFTPTLRLHGCSGPPRRRHFLLDGEKAREEGAGHARQIEPQQPGDERRDMFEWQEWNDRSSAHARSCCNESSHHFVERGKVP